MFAKGVNNRNGILNLARDFHSFTRNRHSYPPPTVAEDFAPRSRFDAGSTIMAWPESSKGRVASMSGCRGWRSTIRICCLGCFPFVHLTLPSVATEDLLTQKQTFSCALFSTSRKGTPYRNCETLHITCWSSPCSKHYCSNCILSHHFHWTRKLKLLRKHAARFLSFSFVRGIKITHSDLTTSFRTGNTEDLSWTRYGRKASIN